MRTAFLIASLIAAATTTSALADVKPSADEAASIKATLTSIGCSGGEFEKEEGKSGGGQRTAVFEIDDAMCSGAAYDLKLDKDYKVIIMSRD